MQLAARRLGALVGEGLLTPARGLDALLAGGAGSADRSGLRARLAHALQDAARDRAWQRRAAAVAVCAAVRPALARRAGRDAILHAAASADPEGMLAGAERRAIASEMVARWLAGAGQGAGSGAGRGAAHGG